MIELKNQNEIILEELKTAKIETENGRQKVEFLNNELEISKRESIKLIEQQFDHKNLQKDWQQTHFKVIKPPQRRQVTKRLLIKI